VALSLGKTPIALGTSLYPHREMLERELLCVAAFKVGCCEPDTRGNQQQDTR
jgi:hypothetical protein